MLPDLLNEQIVIGAVQLLLGNWLKRAKEFENRWIPVATFIAAVLGFTLAPASAEAASALSAGSPALGIFMSALVQNLLVTGTHSTVKNTIVPAGTSALTWLAYRILKLKP